MDRRPFLPTALGALAVVVSLAGCGGGGGSDGGGVTIDVPVTSVIVSQNGTAQFVEGDSARIDFTIDVGGTLAGGLVPVLTVDRAVLTATIDTPQPGRFVVTLATVPDLAPDTYSGRIGFQLCTDASCRVAIAGSQQSVPYTVTGQLADWSTFQRNAGHTGYVNASLDATKFARLWTWSRPAGDPEPIGGINAVATGGGRVYVSKDVYFGQGEVYALDEATGAVRWNYAFGQLASQGPPAFAGGKVYVTTTDPAENCVTWALDATAGTYRFKMPYGCQWSNFFAPTVAGGAVTVASQDGTVHAYAAADGTETWSRPVGSADQATPASDGRYVYQYGTTSTGRALSVLDRATGARVATIDDPFATGFSGYSLFSAPMLGSLGNAVSFSGGGFSGRAASSSEQFDSRVLVSYDVARRAVAWRSADAYLAHPAIAGGVVYAARNAPARLDALSEVDGRVLWSWTPPAGNASFHRNLVVTRNLVFVSTDANVYAISLATRAAVWSYPKPGMLAISAGKVLYIATGATISDGDLVAIKLD